MATMIDVRLPHATAEAIARAIGPDWASTQDPDNMSDYTREERATLTYCGDDPLLTGAALDGWTRRGNTGQIEWRANLHAGGKSGSGIGKYVKDCLPYHAREAFVSSINVSVSKSPERTAKELTTRLLTHYLPAYRAAMVRLQEEQAQAAADETLAAELAGLLGVPIRRYPYNGNKAPTLTLPVFDGARVEHGKLYIERGCSLTAQQARELCALALTWKTRKGK